MDEEKYNNYAWSQPEEISEEVSGAAENNKYNQYTYTPEQGTPGTYGDRSGQPAGNNNFGQYTYGNSVQPQNQQTYGQAQNQAAYGQTQNQQTYGQAQPTYGQQSQTYAQPQTQQTYAQPQTQAAYGQTQNQQTYGQAQPTYGQQSQTYAQPQTQQTYGQAQNQAAYGQSQQTYAQPQNQQTYGQAQPTYSQPGQTYAQPQNQQTYGQAQNQAAYGQSQPTYGQQSQTYGQPGQTYGSAYNHYYYNANAPRNMEPPKPVDPKERIKAIIAMASGILSLIMLMSTIVVASIIRIRFYNQITAMVITSILGLGCGIAANVLSSLFTKANGNRHIAFSRVGKITGMIGTIAGGIAVLICLLIAGDAVL